jgi:predicted AAA+ superfamily ATPase
MRFILTGSSARKLRRESVNLLAGRAFVYSLFPLTSEELGDRFNLDDVLNFGSLPHVFSLEPEDRAEFLRAYTQTFVKEEIIQEQLVRNAGAFRDFLEISAQENGKSLNFSKMARDLGVDVKTVQSYFEILEDTLIGFRLPAFHTSVRKSQKHQPKFYLFDLGVKKAMERSLGSLLTPRTAAYGHAFEHFVIAEIFRLNEYHRSDYKLSHYQTSAGGEVDLILSKGRQLIAIEIKSTSQIDIIEVKKMARVCEALKPTQSFFVSQDPTPSVIGSVKCIPWHKLFLELF